MARAFGVDISKWQGNGDHSQPHGVDFVKLLSKVDFLIVRAGYASTNGVYRDERVVQFMDDLVPLLSQQFKGTPFTFYWYFRDDASVAQQADVFAAVVNKYKAVITLPLVIDAESFVLSPKYSNQKIANFKEMVEPKTGLKVDILYGRAGQLNEETEPDVSLAYPHLWVARYDPALDPQTGQPWVEGGVQEYVEPRDWDKWTIWQYSSTGRGEELGVVSKSIDQNVFNGTVEELLKWAQVEPPVEPPVDPDPGDGEFVTRITNFEVPIVEDFNTLTIQPDGFVNAIGFELNMAKGLVQYCRVFVEADGERVMINKFYCGSRDWLWYELPYWVHVSPDVKLTLEFQKYNSISPTGIVFVNFLTEDWEA